jgi:hypothetical protein
MRSLAGKNPGNLLNNIIENDEMIDKIKNELGYTVRQTVLTQLKDFKKMKGILKTYIMYCNVLNYAVSFRLVKGNEEYEGKKLEVILEKIRKNYNMTKKLFAKEKLDLTDYNYTYITFERKSCQFSKIKDIFEKKLEYDLYYILKYKE